MSMKLTPAAATSTSSWPGPGDSGSRSATTRTSGPPVLFTTTARMPPSSPPARRKCAGTAAAAARRTHNELPRARAGTGAGHTRRHAESVPKRLLLPPFAHTNWAAATSRPEVFGRGQAGPGPVKPFPQGERCLDVVAVVGEQPVAGRLRGTGIAHADGLRGTGIAHADGLRGTGIAHAVGLRGTGVGRADGLVVADHGLGAAGVLDLPGEPGQRGHPLEPGEGSRQELRLEHGEQVHPL